MRYEIQNLRNRGMMRFHRISPCPKCGGKVKAKWECDSFVDLPGYWFYDAVFRCTVCGLAFEGGYSITRNVNQMQRSIAEWNRICNGDRHFTLIYESLGGRR